MVTSKHINELTDAELAGMVRNSTIRNGHDDKELSESDGAATTEEAVVAFQDFIDWQDTFFVVVDLGNKFFNVVPDQYSDQY